MAGHQKGADTALTITRACKERGIKYLTFYIFSLENLNRSEEEKSYLFDLMLSEFKRRTQTEFKEENIKVRVVGDRSKFPAHCLSMFDDVESMTADCNDLQVQFLFCYGGQQEIVAAARQLAKEAQAGTLNPDELTIEHFSERTWCGNIPAPEMVIRTGGVTRVSNFLLFQIAYSELFFSPTLWPDFNSHELDQMIVEFHQRKRNFGK